MLRRLLILFLASAASLSVWAQDAEGIYNKVDENPSPSKTVKPEYPRDLKRDGVEGIVAVAIVIDETGSVVSAKVSKSSNPGFDQAALDAISKWKFKPGKKEGKAVKVRVTIPFRFNLED